MTPLPGSGWRYPWKIMSGPVVVLLEPLIAILRRFRPVPGLVTGADGGDPLIVVEGVPQRGSPARLRAQQRQVKGQLAASAASTARASSRSSTSPPALSGPGQSGAASTGTSRPAARR